MRIKTNRSARRFARRDDDDPGSLAGLALLGLAMVALVVAGGWAARGRRSAPRHIGHLRIEELEVGRVRVRGQTPRWLEGEDDEMPDTLVRRRFDASAGWKESPGH